MNEPYVSVGVLSDKSIKFTLKGIYSTDDVANRKLRCRIPGLPLYGTGKITPQ